MKTSILTEPVELRKRLKTKNLHSSGLLLPSIHWGISFFVIAMLSTSALTADAETGKSSSRPADGIASEAKRGSAVRGNHPQYRGCNLVGGGAQGAWTGWVGANVAARSPGEGPQTPRDYEFVTNADIDYLASRGMNTFRLLFIHEAIQPEAFAAIPYKGKLPNASRYAAYHAKFKALVDYITITKGKICLIDVHNAEGTYPAGWTSYYLRQFSMTPMDAQENGKVLADLWGKLAKIFLHNPNVWFGIQNEPTTRSDQWYPVAQACIDAIRATGNKNKICMPSHDASGARSFVDGGSEKLFAALKDPANNTVIQLHTYYDSNNSGNAEIRPNTGRYFPDKVNGVPATATQIGEARLTAATNWARAHGKQIFIGELALCQTALDGSDQTAQMTATWRNTMDYINANADVIIGFAFWEYGPARWSGNIFDLRQSNGEDNARMNIIKNDFVDDKKGHH
jgi:endoglucanase